MKDSGKTTDNFFFFFLDVNQALVNLLIYSTIFSTDISRKHFSQLYLYEQITLNVNQQFQKDMELHKNTFCFSPL